MTVTVVGTVGTAWCCQATPSTWGSTGEMGYLIDNTGQIWETTTGATWTPKR